MKKFLVAVLFISVVFLSTAGSALAIPKIWNASEIYSSSIFINYPDSDDLSIDLKVDGYVSGMSVSDYILTIFLRDDKGPGDGNEHAKLIAWGESDDSQAMQSLTVGTTLLGIADIMNDGILSFSVASLTGDFFVSGASLTAFGDDGTGDGTSGAIPNPEPSTMFLMMIGGLAIAAKSRLRKPA